LEELEMVAEGQGIPVIYDLHFDVARLWIHEDGEPWFLGVPAQFGHLARAWAVAHECGHLMQMHSPAFDRELYLRQEAEANRWAADALIPLDKPTFDECLEVLVENYQQELPGNLGVFIACRKLGLAERTA
jgi:hypothetical protein